MIARSRKIANARFRQIQTLDYKPAYFGEKYANHEIYFQNYRFAVSVIADRRVPGSFILGLGPGREQPII